MAQLQDVFWDGFADEIEKISRMSGRARALVAGGVAAAGLGALGSSGKKGKDKAEKIVTDAGKTKRDQFAAQTGEEY